MPLPKPLPADPGQESVWDYPRPPRLERTTKRIVIVCNGQTILDTTGAYRVLETSHPPTYYLPPGDFKPGVLVPTQGSSVCEWKGQAVYFDIIVDGRVIPQAAWAYPRPTPPFLAIKDYVACYAGPMDAVTVDGVLQGRAFYANASGRHWWWHRWCRGGLPSGPGRVERHRYRRQGRV